MQEKIKKYSFKDDYSEGAHPNILKAMAESNLIQQAGYGEDEYSLQAAELIRDKIQNKDTDVHFVSSGTQANLIVLSSLLKSYESIISANSGHINTHEAGAVESTGHKINAVDSLDGKLTPAKIKNISEYHTDEHMVKPRVVFISNSTEVGTIYSKRELEEISECCKSLNLLLYMDGARLGSALASTKNDAALSDIAKLTDVFYIGGTKNGALLGEAIVIVNDDLKENFRFHLKQKGALLSKGRILGLQFLELFKDDLFFILAMQGNCMAMKLADGIKKQGYNFLTNSYSNQIFPIFPNAIIEKLSKKYEFYMWEKIDENYSAIRLVAS
ncbi:MAG: aminotransferase class V-fold PLP-dependent enzyme [bacterium]